jgi:hypothetical protein
LKVKIDNLEYEYKFIKKLRHDYLENECLFTASKMWLNSGSAILLQIFVCAIDYISVVEDLRLKSKWSQYIDYFKSRGELD